MSAAQTVEKATVGITVIHLPGEGFNDAQFFEFCRLNNELRIERKANGKIIVMSPTSASTGRWNANISGELFAWNKKMNLGEVFDSSSGFTLPNNAVLSPDAAWIRSDRWKSLGKTEQHKFAPICPDFILELRSDSDVLTTLREKMNEYITNGCRLAWLVDPSKQQTMVYRPDGSVEVVPFSEKLNGGEVLPGFEVVMGEVITD